MSYVFSPYYQSYVLIHNILPGQHPAILDYSVSPNSSFGPDYNCSNCQCYGFPCANCKDYIIDAKPLPLPSLDPQWILDFSSPPSSPSGSSSDSSFQDQIDLISSRKIAWADVED